MADGVNRGGRPSKLDAARAAAICEQIGRGVPRETAASVCGVSARALFTWLARGQRERTGRYAQFLQDVERATSEAERMAIDTIRQASIGGAVLSEETVTRKDGSAVTRKTYTRPEWTAAAWYLERAHRDRWGRTDRVDLRVLSEQVAGDEGLTDVEREQLQQELAAFLKTNR